MESELSTEHRSQLTTNGNSGICEETKKEKQHIFHDCKSLSMHNSCSFVVRICNSWLFIYLTSNFVEKRLFWNFGNPRVDCTSYSFNIQMRDCLEKENFLLNWIFTLDVRDNCDLRLRKMWYFFLSLAFKELYFVIIVRGTKYKCWSFQLRIRCVRPSMVDVNIITYTLFRLKFRSTGVEFWISDFYSF